MKTIHTIEEANALPRGTVITAQYTHPSAPTILQRTIAGWWIPGHEAEWDLNDLPGVLPANLLWPIEPDPAPERDVLTVDAGAWVLVLKSDRDGVDAVVERLFATELDALRAANRSGGRSYATFMKWGQTLFSGTRVIES